WRDLIYGAVVARTHIHLAGAVEGDAGRIHQLGAERLHVVAGVDAVDGDGRLLPALSGERDVDVALGVERRVRDGMQVLRDGRGDADLRGIRRAAVAGDGERTRRRFVGNAGDEELV